MHAANTDAELINKFIGRAIQQASSFHEEGKQEGDEIHQRQLFPVRRNICLRSLSLEPELRRPHSMGPQPQFSRTHGHEGGCAVSLLLRRRPVKREK